MREREREGELERGKFVIYAMSFTQLELDTFQQYNEGNEWFLINADASFLDFLHISTNR